MPPVKTHIWNTDIRSLAARWIKPKPARNKHLAIFCRQMSFALDAGVPLKTAIPLLAGQAPKTLRDGLQATHQRILNGESFSQGLTATGVFPAFLCSMCQIGEFSARLPQVMTELSDYYEQQSRAEEELTAALMYPIIVTGMMLAVIVMALVYVLPRYTAMFAATGVTLPVLTRGLIAFSDGLVSRRYSIMALGALFIMALSLLSNSLPGRRFSAHIRLFCPGVRVIYRQTVNLRLVQAMSLLLLSGQTLIDSVRAATAVFDNVRIQKDLQLLAAGMEEGLPFWTQLARIPYMDALWVSMVRLGEETGSLPQTTAKCRTYLQQENAAMTRRLGKLVEPVITIVLGLTLGLIMLSIMLPTFALTDVM